MESSNEIENSAASVMDLTDHYNRFMDDEYPLASATAAFLRLNDSKHTSRGYTKSHDHLFTGSTMSRNVKTILDENPGSLDNDIESKRKSKRPSSMAAALSLLYDQYESRLRRKDDDKDYDEAWPHSPLLSCTNSSIYRKVSTKVAILKEGLHPESRQRRRSSDGRPLISCDYEIEEPIYMDPNSIVNTDRRRSVFYADVSVDCLKSQNDLIDATKSYSSAPWENKARSQLPRNALLQYFGKTTVRPEETEKLDLTRAILELTDPSARGRGSSTFVLIRILDDELILEGRAETSDEKLNSGSKTFSSKIRKRFSMERRKNHKSSNGLFRKRSSPAIGSTDKIKPNKKSVINLREANMDMGTYGEINRGFDATENYEKKSPKRSGLCMDIFLCMGCKSRSSQYAASTFENEELPSATKTTTLSNPVPGNKVLDAFELKRIVYCGTEHADNLGVYLLTWLYDATYSTEHAIECHAAACDDLQHAKSLATSLGEAIRKVISN